MDYRNRVADLINEIETKFPVSDWIINGIHIWPVIRINLAFKLYSSELPESGLNKRIAAKYIYKGAKFLLGWFRHHFYSLFNFQGNATLSKNGLIFLDYTTSRTLVGKHWYNWLSGPIQDIFEEKKLNTIIFEIAPNDEYRVPRFQKSKYIQSDINTIEVINCILKNRGNNDSINGYEEVSDYICSQVGINLSFREIISHVNLIRKFACYWENKLKQIRPVMVFTVTYYSAIGMALNIACRRLSIPTVDIQHGAQGDNHIAYGRWLNLPANGYDLLPQIFWVWSEREKEAINDWCKQHKGIHDVFVGGNQWLNMWLNKNCKNQFVHSYDKLINDMVEITGKTILYTLQPGYDPPDWLLMYFSKHKNKYNLLVRMHPGMWHESKRIEKMFLGYQLNNVYLKQASQLPLPSLLRNVHLHITQFSSAVIEAMHFNVPSIVVHKYGEQLFSDLIKNNVVSFANNIHEMEYNIIRLFNQGNRNALPINENRQLFSIDDLYKLAGVEMVRQN